MRRSLSQVLWWGEKWVDESVPASDLLAYLEESLRRMELDILNHPENWTGRMLSEFESSRQSLALIGGDAPEIPRPAQLMSEFLPDSQAVSDWLEGMPDGRIVIRDGIECGTGAHFRALVQMSDAEPDTVWMDSMERLLRHVEVRRKNALTVPGAAPEARWIERHDIAILFLETTRKTGDERFLNAALKLNDWAYRDHRYSQISPGMSRYIYSLALQEEMMYLRSGK